MRVDESIRWAILVFVLGVSSEGFGTFDEGMIAYKKADYATALREFNPLAVSGDAVAQYALGVMYENGQGVTKDERQAFYWYRKAAERGNTLAQNNIGNMYFNGQGAPKDVVQAVYWYRKAADQGDAGAQNNLGISYASGEGVNKDVAQAAYWYRKAAEQGEANSQFNLAVMYRKGEGVPKDVVQAVYWYRKAAEQGHTGAQFNLGNSYARGEGAPKDDEFAYFWFSLAAAQGDQDATHNRDIIERTLSSTQRARAQAAARNWKPVAAGSGAPAAQPFAHVPQTPETQVPAVASPSSTGTGFALTGKHVLTNAHVVEGCTRVALAGRNAAKVLAVDKRSDLALIETSGLTHFATLRTGRLRQGDAVAVVGFPLNGLLASGAQVTAGNVSALAGLQNDSRFIQISAPVQPGNSGGPLLDSAGHVAGVVVSKLNAAKIAEITGDIPQNVNFAISPLVLQGFLDANGIEYQSAASTKTLSTPNVAEMAKKYTFLVQCWN